ncbi:MAG: response regulator transcription factor [Lewinella sp.]|nr:response regulator transcription factor [Lewinella sp.]
MIRCIAIDDEPRALEVISSHASRIDFLDLQATFVDPFQALTFLASQPVDLIFLDINMPDLNGLDFFRQLAPAPLVIFTTAHSEYAVASYEVAAVDYLLKPFTFPRFLKAVSRARQRLTGTAATTADYFFVSTGQQQRRLFYRDIHFVEGEGNYVSYHTPQGKVLVRASIRETLAQLPGEGFIQVHRSFIVAIPWIEKIDNHHVHLPGRRISIGATYRDDFYRRIEGLSR